MIDLLFYPALIALAILSILCALYIFAFAALRWRRDVAIEAKFWHEGTMRDGKWNVPVSINMGTPRGCFYIIRIRSLSHVLRRWFWGKGWKQTTVCHYQYLKLADAIDDFSSYKLPEIK